MLALELDKNDVKSFMGRLLREEIFDAFEARTAEISAFVRITLDGVKEAPEDGAAKGGFSLWSEVRPLVFEIIKASSKPRHMKMIFSHNAAEEIHTNAAALFLNVLYENDSLTFTTATAQKEFALDKSLDTAWDTWVRSFFEKIGVNVKDRE